MATACIRDVAVFLTVFICLVGGCGQQSGTVAREGGANSAALEFRILAERSPASPELLKASELSYVEPVGRYIEQLSRHGPALQHEDNYQWIEIAGPFEEDTWRNQRLIVQTSNGVHYVLAHAKPDMCLLADGTSRLCARNWLQPV